MRERYPDAQIELIASRGGRFEVAVDGAPVFEKSRLGRHAKPGEIAELVARTRDGDRR
jgi:selT/selW/selH-like putative selenoprotein